MEELRKRIEEKIKLEDAKALKKMLDILNGVGIEGASPCGDEQVISGLQNVLAGTRRHRVQEEYNTAMKKIIDYLERDVLCDQTQTTDTNQTTSTAGAHTANGNAESSE